jgi:hypothetical protein
MPRYESIWSEPDFFKPYYSERLINPKTVPIFQLLVKKDTVGVKINVFGRLFVMAFPRRKGGK